MLCSFAASTRAWQWPNSKASSLTLRSATTQGSLARNPNHLEAEALRCPCAERDTRSRYAQHPEDGHQLRVYIGAIVLYHARIVCAIHRACQQAHFSRMEFCTAAPATRVMHAIQSMGYSGHRVHKCHMITVASSHCK